MSQARRHNVFISHHDADRGYKRRFVEMMGDLIVNKSVDEDDIDDSTLATETVRQEIREGFIRQASVTIVLIGPCTWQRMHVDWELNASIRQTDFSQRCGLLGLWLPNHPDYPRDNYNRRLVPARLIDNIGGDDPYARLYNWPEQRPRRRETVQQWIEEAFRRRGGTPPDSNRRLLQGNSGGHCSSGW